MPAPWKLPQKIPTKIRMQKPQDWGKLSTHIWGCMERMVMTNIDSCISRCPAFDITSFVNLFATSFPHKPNYLHQAPRNTTEIRH